MFYNSSLTTKDESTSTRAPSSNASASEDENARHSRLHGTIALDNAS